MHLCVFLTGEGDCSYLPNTTVEPTGVSLGEGAYGEVCEVSYKGNIYAAKKYKISKKEELINLHKRLKAFIQEVQIPLLISHPNIVPYCGVCRLKGDGDNQVIVMERMDKNLTEYLKEGLITLDKKFRMLLHVAKGLQHLHQKKPAIIHRDLTANNVLLKMKPNPLVSLFYLFVARGGGHRQRRTDHHQVTLPLRVRAEGVYPRCACAPRVKTK